MKINSSIKGFRQGGLWAKILEKTKQARKTGALLSIQTDYHYVEEAGIRFFVRVLTSLARKDEAGRQQDRQAAGGKRVNPFLPYEDNLFVSDLSESHVAVLNKFNVVDHHLLIITRFFEDQETLLTLKDFEALWKCLAEYPGLGFYNGGAAAGASQPHKHLQVVPLPLAPEGPRIPVEPLFGAGEPGGAPGTVGALPFLHVYHRFGRGTAGSAPAEAERAFTLYAEMLETIGMSTPSPDSQVKQSGPYCLLVTREWMLLVPRSQEFFEGISVNSLGFAGALLVRNAEQLERVKEKGPLTVLKAVSIPKEQASS